jgi:hypothetical protein
MGVWMCVNSLAKGEEERSELQKKVFRQLFFFQISRAAPETLISYSPPAHAPPKISPLAPPTTIVFILNI